MASKIDQFWEILKAVAGEPSTIPDSLNAIAKADRTKLDSYFTNVIDQVSFSTTDYNRLRKFLVDLFASHRTMVTASAQVSDVHSLSNSDLDELFRSFGYDHSTILKGFDENPLEQKIQFFLNLIDLYKIKGTPQALVEVLQFYGITQVDIFEFFLKQDTSGNLIFDGFPVAGTSINLSNFQMPFSNVAAVDPHWLYTPQQILQLNQANKINLPSKTPYIGIQPVVDVDGPEMSILVRKVQDQYAEYQATGTLVEDAEITYVGKIHSMLELYLSSLYTFIKQHNPGVDSTAYICYDGTNTSTIDIIEEYNLITGRPITRADQRAKLQQYYDLFTRQTPTNFLQIRTDAGTILNSINPTLKAQLDAALDQVELLNSLVKDLAVWVRNNMGLGFINFAFILPGIAEYFKDLKNVISFFKPYRARLLLLETMQIRNRLQNSIIVEDMLDPIDMDIFIHDFMTANSLPCCGTGDIDSTSPIICVGESTTKCTREFVNPPPGSFTWKGTWTRELLYSVNDVVSSGADGIQYKCIQSHISVDDFKPGTGIDWTLYWEDFSEMVCVDTTAGVTFYSRETYDCGSYHDIGAVVDQHINPDRSTLKIEYEDKFHDPLMCIPSDSTNLVENWVASGWDGTSMEEHVVDSTTTLYGIEFEDSSSPIVLCQSGNWVYYDEGGTFDCPTGRDLINITIYPEVGYILKEDGGYLLQENDGRLLL